MAEPRRWRRRPFVAGLLAAGAFALGHPLRVRGADHPPDDAPSAEAPAVSDQQTSYGAPVWMRIPRISVDNPTVDVGVVDGFYDVPWFDIGHHADSANPGDPGNSIFNGHVLTIGAGRVFARLNDLAPGDAVFVYTAAYRIGWAVAATVALPNVDDTFLEQSTEPRLTLYTCTGWFNPFERNYAERLVIVGELAEVVPRVD